MVRRSQSTGYPGRSTERAFWRSRHFTGMPLTLVLSATYSVRFASRSARRKPIVLTPSCDLRLATLAKNVGDIPARIGCESQKKYQPPEREDGSHPQLVTLDAQSFRQDA